MELAIILYGITRDQAHLTSLSFYEKIISPLLKHFKVTIYLHSLELQSCPITRTSSQTQPIKNPQDWKLFKPNYYASIMQETFFKDFDFSNYLYNVPDPFGDGKQSCKNYIKGLYSLQESFSLSLPRKYNCYFISRLDLLYSSNNDLIESCLDVANHQSQNIFYTPAWQKNKGLNDRIAIGNFRVSNLYCHRFRDYLLYKKTASYHNIHSESMMKRFSQYNNLSNKHFKFLGSRIRINGKIEKERMTP